MAQRVTCEGLPPTRPSKTDLLWDAISRRPSSVSPFKVCISCTKLPPLPLDTGKAGVERPGQLGPPLDVFGNQGLTDLPIYCHSWLRKNQKCPWGSSEFFLKLHAKLAKVSLCPSQLDFLLLYFAYPLSPSLINTLLTKSSGGICFWST